jgi:hypothetical protein
MSNNNTKNTLPLSFYANLAEKFASDFVSVSKGQMDAPSELIYKVA